MDGRALRRLLREGRSPLADLADDVPDRLAGIVEGPSPADTR
jgi:hypothetical protein